MTDLKSLQRCQDLADQVRANWAAARCPIVQQTVAKIAASYFRGSGRLEGDSFASNLMTQLSSSLLDN
jgi:hypothetical protein